MSKSLVLRFRLIVLPALLAASLLAATQYRREMPAKVWAQSEPGTPVTLKGYVLQQGEGETLERPSGQIVIKADPRTGSGSLAVGTQQLLAGSGIRVHRHEGEDEVLWIQQGSCTAILGDSRKAVGKDTFVYVPKGVWHGLENPKDEVRLVWIVSPPGLENFFRDVGTPPGTKPRNLTLDQMNDIARKHGTSFKIP
jgi:mannose-6-phosphate isomerase-like protein (cupin superfamily)